ncbi:MAG TPA: S4 domain-containing protein, partial [Burkholderiales bacterium]|nr:S4 domain-containing protein [Burkholderiales bacterium]
EIVERFHDRRAAAAALEDFEARFRGGGIPEDIAEFRLQAIDAEMPLVQILKQTGLTSSTSEAIRMIGQGGVKIDGEKVEDKSLKLGKGMEAVLQIGKRKYARVVIE